MPTSKREGAENTSRKPEKLVVTQKTSTRSSKDTKTVGGEEKKNKHNMVIPYVARFSEKLWRILNKHHIPVFFKPCNPLRQKLVHPNHYTPKHKQSS